MEGQQSMCGLTDPIKSVGGIQSLKGQGTLHFGEMKNANPPVESLLEPPSLLARYTCASIMMAVFAIWCKYTFVGESQSPGVSTEVHSYKTPLMLTVGYLVSLQILKIFSREYLSKMVDVKLLLTESMILYNLGQVALNAWMVYKFLSALYHGHPFVGDIHATGATYAVWVHYCDKYLEFFDTYFMVLRGKMDQVSPACTISTDMNV
jgi:elongation of very long chain fatty acids protein 4